MGLCGAMACLISLLSLNNDTVLQRFGATPSLWDGGAVIYNVGHWLPVPDVSSLTRILTEVKHTRARQGCFLLECVSKAVVPSSHSAFMLNQKRVPTLPDDAAQHLAVCDNAYYCSLTCCGGQSSELSGIIFQRRISFGADARVAASPPSAWGAALPAVLEINHNTCGHSEGRQVRTSRICDCNSALES